VRHKIGIYTASHVHVNSVLNTHWLNNFLACHAVFICVNLGTLTLCIFLTDSFYYVFLIHHVHLIYWYQFHLFVQQVPWDHWRGVRLEEGVLNCCSKGIPTRNKGRPPTSYSYFWKWCWFHNCLLLFHDHSLVCLFKKLSYFLHLS
jgi:hypothetical protein